MNEINQVQYTHEVNAAFGGREAVEAVVFRPGGEAQHITVSIGIAALTPERDTVSRMMAAADAALYRAKSEGRNRVCIEH